MGKSNIGSALIGAAIVAGGVATPVQAVFAQAARSGGNVSAQMAQQMQQLAAERTALQTENARLKGELEALRKEGLATKTKQTGDGRRVGELSAALVRTTAARESADRENQQLKERTQELVEKFRETVQSLRETEAAAADSRNLLASRDQELQSCRSRNTALFQLNDDVLKRLEGRGAFSSLARAEPFTRLKRIELENLVDEQRSKAEDQKDPGSSPAR
jgi:chromosome segregation ATPase